ncbi:class I SAM-dependent methyltransferase [Belnapia sp. T18]|uniref:Class I SAM-dependent methyltransferase n=1 Tax=Belnapia arida TaxID=2804533 RepID=A0ABS1UC00_9PROT|nr:rhamnan synthesis F family protein [Belnapia arida]MBL6082184.1 class I SAM-dependent methyltransferase [Belnapia arida]
MLDKPEIAALGDEMTWGAVRIAQPSPWAGHIPFAFWLVKALRPDCLVELGTHSGNSYFAFCQALNVFCPGARAYAVDTWRGDEHAGLYGEDVYADVAAFNAEHFVQFSTLLRTTFDDARSYFPDGGPDGGIDLLHIDGLHSYEAVKHDFETWRSTLSPRGVVLFHDINVRERGFGVWRLWEELRRQYPSYSFDHSNGLGLLGVGTDQAPALSSLFALPPKDAADFRRRIAARGEAFQRQADALALQEQIAAKDRHIADLTAQIGVLTGQVSATDAEARRDADWRGSLLAALREQLASKDALIQMLSNTASARGAALTARDRIIDARDELVMRLSTSLREQQGEQGQDLELSLRDREMRLAQAQQDRDAMADALNRTRAEAQQAVQAVAQQYVNSTSWRVTRPLRVGMRLLRERRLRPEPSAPLQVSFADAPSAAPPPAVAALPTEEIAPASSAKAAMRAMLSARLDAFLSGVTELRLPRVERPDVSIVLVLHNQAELTFGCLGSIAETLSDGGLGVEVVILDNASTDRTAMLLDRIEGPEIIRSKTNLHFLKGVNLAARSATGRALLLLNNDAQLLPGAVTAALRTLDSQPDIGAVGGRIILPDGTLQEAGSILWRNGAAAGYGRGQDPNTPDFMFQRDVDYCSGAFLLTPMAVWREMGGFDERYAPAYYEETDYCLRLWESGRRVVFDPDVVIMHYEFGSSSSAADALALQATNHRIFVEQHREWLDGQFPLDPMNVIAARTARSSRRRILVLDDRVPKPELGRGYPRANRFLHELLEAGADVALFPMNRHAETWHGVRRALDKRIEVLIAADRTQIRAYLEARRGHFDAIIVCRPPNMAAFEEAIGSDRDLIGEARVIYDAEALFVTRDLQRREALGEAPAEPERHLMVASEVALTRLADSVVSVSPSEQDTLETYGARDVRILGHALDDAPLSTGFDERDRIVFLGAIDAEDAPNADAVRWFANAVLPELRRSLGEEMRLTVIGLAQAPSIAALDGTALELVGMVDDLHAALARARVMVVPSRLGAGIPHKAHQAAMLGIPMVVTSLIANQLGWKDGREVLVADESSAFAAACSRLHRDRALWESVRRNALERARQECAPEAFAATVARLVEALPITRRRPEELMRAEQRLPPLPNTDEEPNTSRPAEADFSLAIPFDFPPLQVPPPRVAVICHLYHPEVGQEVRGYLRNLPLPANLFLSTDTAEKADAIRATFSDWEGGRLEVRVLPNRGRDIAPKLVGFADAHADHDLVLHLHSKKSDHAHFLAPWRGFLFESLLGSKAAVSSILDAFARLPQLGMVAPQHYESVRRWLGWNGNYDLALGLARRMGITLSSVRALDFPSGSMFWARPAALRPLLELNLSFDDFPVEGAQVDHTLAHAIERLYFLTCERSGHAWLKVAQPALYAGTDTILPVRSPAELERFLGEFGVALTGPVLLPVRTAPAPLVTRVPPGLAQRLAQRGF